MDVLPAEKKTDTGIPLIPIVKKNDNVYCDSLGKIFA